MDDVRGDFLGPPHGSSFLKIWVENIISPIKHTGNRNIFLKMCSPPPHPRDQQNPFACTCILPIHISYTNDILDLGGGGGGEGWLSKCSKTKL